VSDRLINQQPPQQNNKKLIYWKNRLQQVNDSAAGKIIKWTFAKDIYGDWRTAKGFAINPANILLFEAYYADVEQQLDKMIDLRDKPLRQRSLKELSVVTIAKMVPALPDGITKYMMSDSYKKLIKLVFDIRLEDTLKFTKHFLKATKLIQDQAQTKVKIYDQEKYAQVIQAIQKLDSEDAEVKDEAPKEILKIQDKPEDTPHEAKLSEIGLFKRKPLPIPEAKKSLTSLFIEEYIPESNRADF
jgi:hypothetical protein